MDDLHKKHEDLNKTILTFIASTNVKDADDKKRSLNYLNWLNVKTNIIQQERTVTIPPQIDASIKRGSVVWVEFGFNIGKEFGGRHPALILRRTEDSVFVIPLSSKTPKTIKDYHIKIDKVYNFTNIERWCNVLKIQNISILRIDTNATIGNVKGAVLDNISKALVTIKPY